MPDPARPPLRPPPRPLSRGHLRVLPPSGGARLSEVVSEYALFRTADGMAASSLARDRLHLGALVRFTGDVPLTEIDAACLDAFYVFRAQQLAGNSMNTMTDTLRPFFRFAIRRRHLAADADPTDGRRRYPHTPRPKLRVPVTRFAELLDAAEDSRDRAVVALGLYTLMRQGEIAALLVGDVDLAAGSLAIVVTKSHLRDELPVSAELDAELRRWLAAYTARLHRPLRPGDRLVPARVNARVARGNQHAAAARADREAMPLDPARSPAQLEAVVTPLLAALGYPTRDAAGVSLGEGMHTLRRSGARARFDALVAAGYDGAIREVQMMLHHKAVTTTEHYIGLDLDVARRNASVRGRPMYPQARSDGARPHQGC